MLYRSVVNIILNIYLCKNWDYQYQNKSQQVCYNYLMLAKVHSAQVVGLKVDLVSVEVDISKGLHSFSIVGLPDKAIQEAEDRISAAIKNSGFKSPKKAIVR